MPLRDLIAGIVILVAFLALACGAKEDPFAIGERGNSASNPTVQPAAASSQPQSTDATAASVSTDDTEETSGPQPPPQDELIKFANWEDSPLKLVNWMAGYIVAHGLDRPVRIIDVEDGAYQESLVQNDVDIVFAADPAWADEQAEAGNVVLLGNASPTDGALSIVVHPSMLRRAPDVIELLENFVMDSEVLEQQSARIRGGRVGLKENAVGLDIMKKSPDVWTHWVGAEIVALVLQAIEDGKIGHCREFVNYAPGQQGNEGSRYCKDDPTKTSGNA